MSNEGMALWSANKSTPFVAGWQFENSLEFNLILSTKKNTRIASVNDIGFFHPLPPCPHLEVNSIKFSELPLLRPLFHDPQPWTSYLEVPIVQACAEEVTISARHDQAQFLATWQKLLFA